jgi:hypothetical protein
MANGIIFLASYIGAMALVTYLCIKLDKRIHRYVRRKRIKEQNKPVVLCDNGWVYWKSK